MNTNNSASDASNEPRSMSRGDRLEAEGYIKYLKEEEDYRLLFERIAKLERQIEILNSLNGL